MLLFVSLCVVLMHLNENFPFLMFHLSTKCFVLYNILLTTTKIFLLRDWRYYFYRYYCIKRPGLSGWNRSKFFEKKFHSISWSMDINFFAIAIPSRAIIISLFLNSLRLHTSHLPIILLIWVFTSFSFFND